MSSSDFPTDPNAVLVADASVVINLTAASLFRSLPAGAGAGIPPNGPVWAQRQATEPIYRAFCLSTFSPLRLSPPEP